MTTLQANWCHPSWVSRVLCNVPHLIFCTHAVSAWFCRLEIMRHVQTTRNPATKTPLQRNLGDLLPSLSNVQFIILRWTTLTLNSLNSCWRYFQYDVWDRNTLWLTVKLLCFFTCLRTYGEIQVFKYTQLHVSSDHAGCYDTRPSSKAKISTACHLRQDFRHVIAYSMGVNKLKPPTQSQNGPWLPLPLYSVFRSPPQPIL